MSSVLDQIAIKYGCDKSSLRHNYCKVYEQYFANMPKDAQFLEVGYGGYDDPNAGGESARMWVEAYPEWHITIIDIVMKTNLPDIRFFAADARTFTIEDNDIVIDDGSHMNADIIATFKNLWHSLKPGGLYCVEDVHSSYDPYYSDSHPMPNGAGTAMAFFTRLAHEANRSFYDPSAHMGYDVEFVHFYKDLVIIKKA